MQEGWIRSLDWEDPLEKGIATHSSIVAWKIPWTEEPGGLQSMGLQRVGHDWAKSNVGSVKKGPDLEYSGVIGPVLVIAVVRSMAETLVVYGETCPWECCLYHHEVFLV